MSKTPPSNLVVSFLAPYILAYQFKLSTLATAATKGPALWTEIATSGISYTKQKSRHRTRSKLTLVFVTHHSNRVTETTLAPLEMNVIEIPLS